MRVLITGAEGFLGRNLVLLFSEINGSEILTFTRQNCISELPALVKDSDWIFHMAGVNRPKNNEEFIAGNVDLTQSICDAVKASCRLIPIVFASSIQAELDNVYGISKRKAENILLSFQSATNNPVYIYRLPNIFGKFARPNYNSVVATFCHNIIFDRPIKVNNPSALISLVYVDDVVESFRGLLEKGIEKRGTFFKVLPEYSTTVGKLADQLYRFKALRENLIVEPVGIGLTRALYSTYMSYLPPEKFSYYIKQYCDDRGVFAEMVKTIDAGQVSFFTARPGVTRGGHYHHSKTEKFLVIKGKARCRFRHAITGERYEINTAGESRQIIETVPGWAHDITNVGDDEMICVVWANEIFDHEKPDTVFYPVDENT